MSRGLGDVYKRQTVRDDIAFGLENICVPREQMDELINRYSKVVRMENFLDHEPTKLSGGQKQRVAIAGILAMSPSIIILDEATSSIDTRTELQIQKAFDEMMKGRTTFIVAHRLSTIKNSDCIMVLEQGHIIERGNHQSLIKEKGKYYQLYTGAIEMD